jgi:hypothetical protein
MNPNVEDDVRTDSEHLAERRTGEVVRLSPEVEAAPHKPRTV